MMQHLDITLPYYLRFPEVISEGEEKNWKNVHVEVETRKGNRNYLKKEKYISRLIWV
jgi:hypothetical protein